jgi:hypothetical protein
MTVKSFTPTTNDYHLSASADAIIFPTFAQIICDRNVDSLTKEDFY